MRVLVYEPRISGHGPVILSYAIKELAARGVDVVLITDYLRIKGKHEWDMLQEIAVEKKCDLIHILTFDHFVRHWMSYRRIKVSEAVPVLGTYFLFGNLEHGVKAMLWRILLLRGLIQRVLICDERIEDRYRWLRKRGFVGYLPDPWDPEEFPFWDQERAQRRLGISGKGQIVMLFGDISERKGAGFLLRAWSNGTVVGSNVTLLFAGRISPEISAKYSAELTQLQASGRLLLSDQVIAESDVSSYFCAADVVVCPYPRSFAVSSGTFLRACAVGTPVVVPAHGYLFEICKRNRFGTTYKTDDLQDFGKALDETIALAPQRRREEAERAMSWARLRTSPVYGECLMKNYVEVTQVREGELREKLVL